MQLYGRGAGCTQPTYFMWLLAIILLVGCDGATPSPQPDQPNDEVTAVAIAAKAPAAQETPTATLLPPPIIKTASLLTETVTPSLTEAPMMTNVTSTQAAVTPTMLSATATPFINRDCNQPGFPGYTRYQLSDAPLPQPLPERTPHFWMTAPMEIDGGLRINNIYPYGYDAGKNAGLLLHVGMDASGLMGAPILATAAGTIIYARSDENELHGWRCNWYGRFVTILHDEQWQGQPVYTLYGHVQNIIVEEGQHVAQGEQVAEVGVGGAAVAPHLHTEVRVGDNLFTTTRNPLLWLRPIAGYGAVVGRLIDESGRAWQGVTVHAIPKGGSVRNMATTWTYLGDRDNLARPDEQYAENFVFGNLTSGIHNIYVELEDRIYQQEVEVFAGGITEVELMTGGDRGATKTPRPTARPYVPPPPTAVPPTPTPSGPATGIPPAVWAATATAEAANR